VGMDRGHQRVPRLSIRSTTRSSARRLTMGLVRRTRLSLDEREGRSMSIHREAIGPVAAKSTAMVVFSLVLSCACRGTAPVEREKQWGKWIRASSENAAQGRLR
jgi:hypothetical protein